MCATVRTCAGTCWKRSCRWARPDRPTVPRALGAREHTSRPDNSRPGAAGARGAEPKSVPTKEINLVHASRFASKLAFSASASARSFCSLFHVVSTGFGLRARHATRDGASATPCPLAASAFPANAPRGGVRACRRGRRDTPPVLRENPTPALVFKSEFDAYRVLKMYFLRIAPTIRYGPVPCARARAHVRRDVERPGKPPEFRPPATVALDSAGAALAQAQRTTLSPSALGIRAPGHAFQSQFSAFGAWTRGGQQGDGVAQQEPRPARWKTAKGCLSFSVFPSRRWFPMMSCGVPCVPRRIRCYRRGRARGQARSWPAATTPAPLSTPTRGGEH